MLCFKKNHTICFTFLSFLVFSFLYIFCFNSVDSFATTESYTVTSSNVSQSHYLCYENGSNVSNCSDFSFLRVTFNNIISPSTLSSSFSSARVNIQFQYNYSNGLGNNFITCYVINSSCTFQFLSGLESLSYQSFTNQSYFISSNSSVLFELSDSPFSSGIVPSGSINLSSNGTYDVSSYAEAVVDVPPVPGDYHDDLINLNNTLVLVPAVALVIFLLYLLNRIIIKGGE